MYRSRNLDIVIATVIAILGGLAYAEHLPGQITIPLGVGLFFAPGYLWSEAILSHHLPGVERALTSAGMAMVFPILGGFLFYALHIPLFRADWVAMLVVLTLLGVVATAVQRLRQTPADRQQPQRQPPRQGGPVVLNTVIFGLAAVIGLAAVGYSVNSAEAQKFPGTSSLSMTPVVDNPIANNMALLSNNDAAQQKASELQNQLVAAAKKAHLEVANHEGVTEKYVLKLLLKGIVSKTYNITLNNGQSWEQTIAYTTNYSMVADLYLLPNTKTVYHYVDNGQCLTNKALVDVIAPQGLCGD